MNPSFLSGLAYLALLTAIPAAGLMVVRRRVASGSGAFTWALLAVPAFAFAFGGAWFALPAWLSRAPDAPPATIPPWSVFVMAGAFSVVYCAAGMAAVGALPGVWRLAHPESFRRRTPRCT